MKHSKETKEKISKAAKLIWADKDRRKKQSETHKKLGSKPPSREGIAHTEEAKEKIGEASKGRKPRLGMVNSIESNIRRGNALRGTPRPPHVVKIIGDSHRGEKCTFWKGGISKDPDHIRTQKKIHKHKRRMLIKEKGQLFTVQEWEELKLEYNYTCPMCKKREPEIKLTMDHIIPVIKNGDNTIDNIQP